MSAASAWWRGTDMLALTLTLVLSGAPSVRVAYEAKCLYCHSAEVAESVRLSPSGWAQLIERMRLKAPLLITRSDVRTLSRFMVNTLGLGVAARLKAEPAKPPPTKPEPEAFKPQLLPLASPDVSVTVSDEAVEPPMEQVELEVNATAVISRRCSKCHSLGRVYGRLDSLERSLSTLERMRFKTGSGISDAEFKTLQRYLHLQFDRPAQ